MQKLRITPNTMFKQAFNFSPAPEGCTSEKTVGCEGGEVGFGEPFANAMEFIRGFRPVTVADINTSKGRGSFSM